jgi:hypothetical protein
MARRKAIKLVAATVALLPKIDWAAESSDPAPARGSPTDPDLLRPLVPWARALTPEELRAISALCDLILPADEHSPSASRVGLPEFIDEWVSAPYPIQKADRKQVQGGIVWLNGESQKRFQKAFAALTEEQKKAIADDICYLPKAKEEFRQGASFFALVRNLAATGFYTTDEGIRDLKYIGNVPSFGFKGPPPEVLEYLKLT